MRYIRNKFGDIIYCIRDDGTITDKHDCDVIGHFKGDRITDKFDIDTLYRIRPDGTITDKYDCDVIGHIHSDGTITDKYDIDTHGSVNTPSSSSDSGGSILGGILTLIGTVILLVLKLIPYLFVYYVLPSLASFTWIYLLMIPFLAIGITPVCIILAIAVGVCNMAFYPYWIMLIIYRIKKQITTKTMLKFYWKWFIKGPFAYKDIIALKNQIKNND